MEERIVVNIEFMQCRSISAIYRIQRLLEAQHAAPLLSQSRLYNLKHMEQLEKLSFKGQKELFNRLEQLAKIANMNKKEREEYEECLKVYRDNYSIALYQKQQAEARVASSPSRNITEYK